MYCSSQESFGMGVCNCASSKGKCVLSFLSRLTCILTTELNPCLFNTFYTLHDFFFRACKMSPMNINVAPNISTPPVNRYRATDCFYLMFLSDPAIGVPIKSPKAQQNDSYRSVKPDATDARSFLHSLLGSALWLKRSAYVAARSDPPSAIVTVCIDESDVRKVFQGVSIASKQLTSFWR